MYRLSGNHCALVSTVALLLANLGTRLSAADGGPPCGCTQWPMFQIGDSVLYYCDYYESTCDDDPQPCYAVGDYDWPQVCPDCIPDTDLEFSQHRFQGLDGAIPEEYVHRLPDGPARDYARAVELPGLKFIRFRAKDGALINAKVFAFTIYKRQLLQQSVRDGGRTIAVAMELKGQPSVAPTAVTCRALEKTEACFAYSTVYDLGNGQRIPILVLTVK